MIPISRLLAAVCLLFAVTAWAGDDYNPKVPAGCGSNANQNALGCSSAGTSLYTFLAQESADERTEYGLGNFIYNGLNANACLGPTAAGLTHTPASCIGYNANIRGTETGSITYANTTTTWVAMDACNQTPTGCQQNNPLIPNFTRVAGTHYLTDAIDGPSTTCAMAIGPCMAVDSQLLMLVTTSGGSITAVEDLRHFNPTPGVPTVGPIFYASQYLIAAGTATTAFDNDTATATSNQTVACTLLNTTMPAGSTLYFNPSGTNVYNFIGGIASNQKVNIIGAPGVIFKREGVASNTACGIGSAGSVGISIGNYAFTGSPKIGFPATTRSYNLGTGYLSAGQTTFMGVTPSPAGELVGSKMLVEYGVDPDDNGQNFQYQWMQVAGVSSSSITFQSGLAEDDPPLTAKAAIPTNFDWHPTFQYNFNGTPGVTKGYMLTPNPTLNAGNFTYEQTGTGTCTSGSSPPVFPQIAGSVTDGTCTWTWRNQQVFPNSPAFSFSPTAHMAYAGLSASDSSIEGLSFIDATTGSPAYDVEIYAVRLIKPTFKGLNFINTQGGLESFQNDSPLIENIQCGDTYGSCVSTSDNHDLTEFNIQGKSIEGTFVYNEGQSRGANIGRISAVGGSSKGTQSFITVFGGSRDFAFHEPNIKNYTNTNALSLSVQNDSTYHIINPVYEGTGITIAPLRATTGTVQYQGQQFGGRVKQYTIGRNVGPSTLIGPINFPSGLVTVLSGQYTDSTFTGLTQVFINNATHTHACQIYQSGSLNYFPTNGSFGDLTSLAAGGDSLTDFCTSIGNDGAYNLNDEPTGRQLWIQTGAGVPLGTYLTISVRTLVPSGGDDGVNGAVSDMQSPQGNTASLVLQADDFPDPPTGTSPLTSFLGGHVFLEQPTVGCTVTGLTACLDVLPIGCTTFGQVGVNTVPAQFATPVMTLGATPSIVDPGLPATAGCYSLTFTPVVIPANQVWRLYLSPPFFGCSTVPQHLQTNVMGHCP